MAREPIVRVPLNFPEACLRTSRTSVNALQVAPPSDVFHTPPSEAPTYRVLASFGWTAIALTWPLMTSLLTSGVPNGPIETQLSATAGRPGKAQSPEGGTATTAAELRGGFLTVFPASSISQGKWRHWELRDMIPGGDSLERGIVCDHGGNPRRRGFHPRPPGDF